MTEVLAQYRGGRRFGPTALGIAPRPTAATIPGGIRAAGDLGGAAPDLVGARGRRSPADRAWAPGGADRRTRRRAVPDCPPGSADGPYRMGRWARLAMTVIVVAAVLVGALTMLLPPAAGPGALVTVQPGETLLTIVQRDLPGWNVGDALAAVEALNGLDGPVVPVGVALRLPAAG